MHRGTRGKAKHAAVVSPVMDESELGEDANPSSMRARMEVQAYSNNMEGGLDIGKNENWFIQLQPKSAGLEPSATGGVGFLRRFFSGQSASNQDNDASCDPAALRYGVLGQKDQWRKQRAQRQRQPQTVSSISYDDDELDELESATRGSNDHSVAYSSASTGSMNSYRERSSAPPSSRSINSSSRSSDSMNSSRSSYASSSSADKQPHMSVRQKRSTFTAKLHIPGQKPLYLGRFKSQEAAQAAYERACSSILTPRSTPTE